QVRSPPRARPRRRRPRLDPRERAGGFLHGAAVDRTGSRAARGRAIVEGERAPDRLAHERRPLPDTGSQRSRRPRTAGRGGPAHREGNGRRTGAAARMLTMIGRTYERMGLHAKALPLLERALALGRTAFPAGHVTVAQSL